MIQHFRGYRIERQCLLRERDLKFTCVGMRAGVVKAVYSMRTGFRLMNSGWVHTTGGCSVLWSWWGNGRAISTARTDL